MRLLFDYVALRWLVSFYVGLCNRLVENIFTRF